MIIISGFRKIQLYSCGDLSTLAIVTPVKDEKNAILKTLFCTVNHEFTSKCTNCSAPISKNRRQINKLHNHRLPANCRKFFFTDVSKQRLSHDTCSRKGT
jgi:hypothetical protein